MKKNTIIAGVLATTLVATTNSVKAEEVTTTTQDVKNIASESTTVVAPTEQEVNKAKSEFNTATEAVTAQEAVVSEKQASVNSEAVKVSEAKTELATAQENASKATQENIAAAEQAVADAETKVADTEQSITEVNTTISKQEAAVATQEKVVASQQEVVEDRKTDVATAKESVSVAQANLDGTGASQVIADQEKAQANVVIAEQEVNTAQDELATAEASDTVRSTTIASKEKAVSSATTQVSATASNLEVAKTTAAATQEALTNATTTLANAKAELDAINSLYVSDEYVQALKNYELGLKGQYDRATAIATLKALNPDLRTANQYKSNANDKSIIISDINNLSTEIIQELSLFGSDLINQVRAKFGTPATAVTSSSIQVADMVTDIYVADNYGWNSIVENSHNDNALDTTGDKFNVLVGENLNTWNRTTTTTTLDQLKSLVYQSMVEFLYNGREWLHARSIAGLDDTGATVSYIGIDVSSIAGATSVHVNDVDSNDLFTGNTFNTTEIVNPKNNTIIRDAFEKAQSSYNQAVATNQVAQTTLANATNSYTSAQNNLATAQAELNAILSTVEQAPAARIKLSTAQANLENAKTVLVLANEAVANLNASIQEKQAILESAKLILAEKETSLATAQSDLATEVTTLNDLKSKVQLSKNTLSTLENELINTKQLLASAKQTLTDLQNAPAVLAAAQAKLDQLTVSLADKYQVLKEELELLEELKGKQLIANETYITLLNAYNTYLAELEEKELKERLDNEYKAIVNNNGTPIPVVDNSGKIIGYTDAKNKSDIINKDLVKPVKTAGSSTKEKIELAKTKSLPNTGEMPSQTLSLGTLLVGLGLLGVYSKKRREEK